MERVELNLKSWFLVKGEARKNYIHNYTSYIAIYIYIESLIYTYTCDIVPPLVERKI